MQKPTKDPTKKTGLVKDQRGAVLAEFVVAIMPLLTIFFVFVQLSSIAVASLLVKHSAVVGARAAAVYASGNDNLPEACGAGGGGDGKVNDAVRAALGTWQDRITATATVTDNSSRAEPDGPYGLVTVRVVATYQCRVPLGRAICPGGTKTITDEKSMPHQGARYRGGC